MFGALNLFYISFACTILVLSSGLYASASTIISNINKKQTYQRVVEPMPGQLQQSNFQVPRYNPGTNDRDNFALIDHIATSANGYGLYSSVTRPLYVSEDDGWFVVFRQFIWEGETHGQVGAVYSEGGPGEDWTEYWNINNDMGYARYPSALGDYD